MTQQHDCKDELREAALKATPARIAVLQLLEKTDTPLDVGAILKDLRSKDIDIDPATAFRIINTFTEKGLTRQIQLHEGKFRYEATMKGEHHHLICDVCGKIEDISDCAIPYLQKDIEKKKGFLVKRHSLEFFGLCNNCQK